MSKEETIRELLDQLVQEISQAQGNPRTWLSWLVHLLAKLEDQAAKTGASNRESFVEMLSALQDDIRNRVRTGGWN